MGAFNSIDKYDARNSHYIGFLSRSNNRLRAPGLYLSQDSMLIALNDRVSHKVIGVVEVCLEAPDGKLAPAVAMRAPWRAMKDHHEPYLCNLCVDSEYRRQGLGLLLCHLAERIVVKYWLKTVMYLHVEVNNIAAQNLYSKMGYELGPQLPSWERRLHGKLLILSLSPLRCSDQDSKTSYTIKSVSSLLPKQISVLMWRRSTRRWLACTEGSVGDKNSFLYAWNFEYIY